MRFETKILLVFGAVSLIVLYLGPGSLSYEEAMSNAKRDKFALDAEQLSQLERKQRRFSAQAIPACTESTGAVPEAFTLVVEIGSGGQVVRSWRQGDSGFAICFQKIATDYFELRSVQPPFFAVFESGESAQ